MTGLHQTTSSHRVLFATVAVLVATGCYKKETPEGELSAGNTIGDTSETEGATEGGTGDDAAESANPTQDGSAAH